jgi:hypothetical protein
MSSDLNPQFLSHLVLLLASDLAALVVVAISPLEEGYDLNSHDSCWHKRFWRLPAPFFVLYIACLLLCTCHIGFCTASLRELRRVFSHRPLRIDLPECGGAALCGPNVGGGGGMVGGGGGRGRREAMCLGPRHRRSSCLSEARISGHSPPPTPAPQHDACCAAAQSPLDARRCRCCPRVENEQAAD